MSEVVVGVEYRLAEAPSQPFHLQAWADGDRRGLELVHGHVLLV